MSLLSTSLLALSMSADAFAVSLGKGTCLKKPRLIDAARTGAVFGGTEAVMPVLGWLLGLAASGFIQSVDHWVAFGILGAVGGKMIWGAVSAAEEPDCATDQMGQTRRGFFLLILTAIGTSIDSLAVGVSLAFWDVPVWIAAPAIGLASFTMSTLGLMIGHAIGTRLGRWAEGLGGLGLIAIGGKILGQHLGYW